MIKKITAALLAVILCVSLAGCGRILSIINLVDKIEDNIPKTFEIASYGVQITADGSFSENTEGAWDLQITDGSVYVSVMVYKYSDLGEDMTPRDVYDVQNEDIFSRRDNVKTISAEKSTELDGKNMIYTRYSAESDGFKNYYDSYLVDIPASETLAWILITGVPSNVENRTAELEKIASSLSPIEKDN